ncbi:P-selectin glycoprotein ligand 1 [Seriola dumerili]|uniref:Selectin P ligand n=1 Tax=Seriola dumerili TaxID=41447 RepID=A0A3B4V4B3_SERDU|nr:P-selectin glycoprotein ligand 1 [Seriola dumerili]
MILLSVKACLTLLWGISVLFSVETESASIPETSSGNSTAEPNKANRPLSTAHAPHNETEVQSAMLDPTHKPAEVAVTATADTVVSPTREAEEVVVSTRGDISNGSTTLSLFAVTGVTTAAGSLGPRTRHTSAVVTPAADDAQHTRDTTSTETATPKDQLQQQSFNTSTHMTAPAITSRASSATVPTFPLQPTSTATPDVTSELSSSTTSANSTDKASHLISSPSASATTLTASPASEATPVFHPTFLPVTTTETPTASAELSSTSQPISRTRTHISTSQFPDTTGLNSTPESPATTASNDSSFSTSASTSAVSTSAAGIFIPHVPKRLPIPTTRSTAAPTAATREVSKSPPSTEVQPCSTRGVVKHCLIAVASLAGLATIFMVSTVILCARLSARKYRVRRPQQATEMMCISALLPERNYSYTRQHNPITNGVLVIPSAGDSEEDGGDNLTLSSFLPENDRFV